MKLIAGLGNPGKKYEKTPHNAGFMALDRLAEMLGCRMKRSIRFKSDIGSSGDVVLLKPRTYMNLSGNAVGRVMRYRKAVPADLVVVLDDADLEPGRIRIRPAGGSGGHRGLESVIAAVGTEDFVRIRIGVGRDDENAGLAGHVLSSLSGEDGRKVSEAVVTAADAVMHLIEKGLESAMNEFNRAR